MTLLPSDQDYPDGWLGDLAKTLITRRPMFPDSFDPPLCRLGRELGFAKPERGDGGSVLVDDAGFEGRPIGGDHGIGETDFMRRNDEGIGGSDFMGRNDEGIGGSGLGGGTDQIGDGGTNQGIGGSDEIKDYIVTGRNDEGIGGSDQIGRTDESIGGDHEI